MDPVVLLCVDGSEDSLAAARTGLTLLAPGGRAVLATVVDSPDPTLLIGAGGVAGGTMSQEEYDELSALRRRDGEQLLDEAAAALGLDDVEREVWDGGAGPTLSRIAAEIGASVIVVGSRGRGGIKRALLGSVSDHLVRNAPCPVLVVRDAVQED
jgi:nucleotide-binding universal stress UspA family protein